MRNFHELISKGFLLLSLSASLSVNASSLTVSASSLGTLPSVLNESSGLDHTGGTHFWSLNDSYGDNNLYRIASDGSLTKTIEVTNAQNRNWEDLAHDAGRAHMYIGDFGNNSNDRTNLRIWKIPYPSTIAGTTVTAELIEFIYPDQEEFPSSWMNFDAEAFIHFQGKLYIFTKPDLNAIGYTKMYSVPDDAGSYVATLVDSFYTNDRPTGADISPDGTSLIVSSNSHIHLFRNFTGHDFFGGTHTQINISGGWTQKEAVTFSSNREIYMTDENTGGGNHLYHIDLSTWIPAPPITTSISDVSKEAISVYPSPANNLATFTFSNASSAARTVSLLDITGKVVYEAKIENAVSTYELPTSSFPTGVYFYKISEGAENIRTSRLVISH